MHVFRPDVEALDRAIRSTTPLLALPPLHPEYIRALLGAWAERTEGWQVRLVEPGVGRSILVTDNGQDSSASFGALRRSESSTALLLDQIESAIPRAGQRTTATVLWLTSIADLFAEPGAVSHLVALCRRIVAHRLPMRLVMDALGPDNRDLLEPWMREVDLVAPRNEEFIEFVDQVVTREVARFYPEKSEKILNVMRIRQEEGQEQPITTISRGLQGLDAGAINLVISSALAGRSAPEGAEGIAEVLTRVEEERARQLDRATGLKVIDNTFEEGDLQGMNRFQRYLEYVQVLFKDPRAVNGPGPSARGVLLVGLPGCGKSLAARMTARKLDVPLLKLDVGEMMGRFLGESEANLSRVLDAAEAAAPCVLWVDEIEKSLGGLGNTDGGGTGSRMLAKLLGWMQEHSSQVYLFATANKVKVLPAELLRRGRFDELWRVMLPTPEERRDILAQKLRALPVDALSEALRSAIDREGPSKVREFEVLWKRKTDGFTGADLESVVFEAWMGYLVHEKAINVRSVVDVIEGGFQPMSTQFKDDIEELKSALERHGFRDVTGDDGSLPPPVPPGRLRHSEPLPPLLRPIWSSNDSVVMTFSAQGGARLVRVELHPDRTGVVHDQERSGSIKVEAHRDGDFILLTAENRHEESSKSHWNLAVRDEKIVLVIDGEHLVLGSKERHESAGRERAPEAGSDQRRHQSRSTRNRKERKSASAGKTARPQDFSRGKESDQCPRCGRQYKRGANWCTRCEVAL